MPDQLHQLLGLHGAGPVHLLQDQCGSHVPGTWAGQQCQGVHAVLLWIQLHLVPGQLLQLQGLQAAGPVHLQVQCGSLHVCGAWAGQHCQGAHAGLSPTRSKSWTPSWSSLSRDMLLTLLGFSPSTWVPQPLFFFSATSKDLQQVFILWAAECLNILPFTSAILSCVQAQMC